MINLNGAAMTQPAALPANPVLSAVPAIAVAHPLRPWASQANTPTRPPALLLVDDDRVLRMMAQETLAQRGYSVATTGDGEAALAQLKADPGAVDAIVLDREMPGLHGLDVLTRLKADPQLAQIPVIMLTGSGEPAKVQEGIDAGVFYYLIKPVSSTLLGSVIEAALRERRQKLALLGELSRHGAALQSMTSCRIAVRSLYEAEDTASFLASIFPQPERVVVGLMELLVNAVEHGNLGITFEQKDALLIANRWREEVERLATLPEHTGKAVDVIYQNNADAHLVQITDCGAGFDWQRYWHINPARATASHGRGIARARMTAFDRMAYNAVGNSVTVMVTKTAAPADTYAW